MEPISKKRGISAAPGAIAGRVFEAATSTAAGLGRGEELAGTTTGITQFLAIVSIVIEGESYRSRLKPGQKAGQRTGKKGK